MKKTKIFAVLGICLAMGLTACGGNTNSDSPKSSANPASTSSRCTHDWGAWVNDTDATCTAGGTRHRTCTKCGETQNGTTSSLGHDYSVFVSDSSTCEQDGKITYKCSRCTETEVKDIKAHHKWGEETTVAAAGDGYVAYKTSECSVDHAKQIKIRALDGTLASGSTNKSGTPEGFMKLNSDGNSRSWKFNLPGTKGFVGILYQRGAMDSFSNNTTKTYANISNSGSATDTVEGNFRVEVNGAKVDKSSMMNVSFEDMTRGGEDSSALGDNYSPIGLCKIGAVSLVPGDNTIVYTRLHSYNLVISDLVIIGQESEHQHQAATEWSKDPTQHWHACVADGCPIADYRMDAEAHTFGDGVPVGEPVCGQEQDVNYTCTECGYVKTEKEVVDHDYEEVNAYSAKGEGAEKTTATKALKCTRCGDSIIEWKAIGFNETLSKETEIVEDGAGVKFAKADKLQPADRAAGTPNKDVQGTLYVYNIDVYAAATDARLSFRIKPYNSYGSPDIFTTQSGDWTTGYVLGEDGETLTASEYRYGLFINGEKVALGPDPYGTDVKGKVGWYDFQAKFDLNKGVNKIEILCLGGYPADAVYDFRLLDLPELVLEHTHTYSDWMSDGTNHWKVCTDPACPDMLEDPTLRFQEAAHTLVKDDEQSTAPTCEGAGTDVKVCSVCGKAVEVPVEPLGHDFSGEKSNDTSTCTADGKITVKCTRCDKTEEQDIKAHHRWGNEETINKSADDEVNYGKSVCSVDNAIQLRIRALDGKIDPGSNKSGTPEGYMKLDGKNNIMTWKFNYGGTKQLIGTLYQYGCMDGWGNTPGQGNRVKTYAHTSSSSNTTEKTRGNFEVKVNTEVIDKTDMIDVHFEDMTADGIDSGLGSSYSPKALCKIGAATIKPGSNTITYERLGSFNLVISDIVFVGMESDHVHQAAAEWSKDETQHWHACVGEGCDNPTIKLDAANHTWNDGEATTPATTSAAGVMTYTCTTCGKTKTEEIPQINLHEWSSADIKAGLTDGNEGSTKCTEKDFNSAIAGVKGYKFNKTAVTSTLTYNVEGEDAVNVKLLYLISVKKDNQSKTGFWTQVDSEEATKPVKCSMTLNGNAVTPPENDVDFTDCTTETSVTDSGTLMKPQWKQVVTLTLQPGANTIVLSYVAGGYSFYICGAAIALA